MDHCEHLESETATVCRHDLIRVPLRLALSIGEKENLTSSALLIGMLTRGGLDSRILRSETRRNGSSH